jgi:hypothetical protein
LAGRWPVSSAADNRERAAAPGPRPAYSLGEGTGVTSFVVATAGYFGYRWLTRGERTDRREATATITGA